MASLWTPGPVGGDSISGSSKNSLSRQSWRSTCNRHTSPRFQHLLDLRGAHCSAPEPKKTCFPHRLSGNPSGPNTLDFFFGRNAAISELFSCSPRAEHLHSANTQARNHSHREREGERGREREGERGRERDRERERGREPMRAAQPAEGVAPQPVGGKGKQRAAVQSSDRASEISSNAPPRASAPAGRC